MKPNPVQLLLGVPIAEHFSPRVRARCRCAISQGSHLSRRQIAELAPYSRASPRRHLAFCMRRALEDMGNNRDLWTGTTGLIR
jgi:hypothetical protein